MDAQDVGAGNEAETEATILGAAREFRSAYADYLESHGRRDEALRAYAELVALDLSKEDGLRERFTRLRPRQPFETWWSRTLPTLLPFAPTVSLRTFDGRELGTAQAPGTWTLLDFWGTWCAPCQPDMPKVDTLYRETLTSKRGRVITVAARDEAETVRAYLTSRNFSYPVVLADDALVNAFGITGFPTKLLIAPNGGMLRLPPDDSWESAARHRLSSEPLN
jgi:thiol-disulfide isomerase/thioredoxin